MVHLTAVQYLRTFNSGHSRPLLLEGETIEGERYEVVVKLRRNVQGMAGGLAREWLASHFASRLGLNTPRPFVVEITPEFAQSIPDSDTRMRLQEDLGWHYASLNLRGNWNAVIYGNTLPYPLVDAASAVFAFDALIRNDDRHQEKANYLIRDSTIMLIDHERAFPARSAAAGIRPWEPGGLDFLRHHAFLPGLRGQLPNFKPMAEAMEATTQEQISGMVATIPPAWDGSGVAAELEGYLMTLRANYRSVLDSIATLLR